MSNSAIEVIQSGTARIEYGRPTVATVPCQRRFQIAIGADFLGDPNVSLVVVGDRVARVLCDAYDSGSCSLEIDVACYIKATG